MKRLIKTIAGAAGLQIKRKPYSAMVPAQEIDSALTTVKGSTMLSRERLISLYDQVVFCERNQIKGSYVECGVWKGGAVAMMAMGSLRHSQSRRNIHLFDAFADICEPDADIDGQRAIEESAPYTDTASGNLQSMKGFYRDVGGHGTLQENRVLLEDVVRYPEEMLHYHVGWFQDTVPEAAKTIGPIAILRLDGDWYESTKVCLEHLYDLVTEGGFIVIDDYGTYDGCKTAVDEFMKSRASHDYLHPVDADCRYLVKSRS